MVLKWDGFGVGSKRAGWRRRRRSASREWLVQAGLADVKVDEFAVIMGLLALLGFGLGLAVFGFLPAVVFAAFAASFPLRTFRKRRDDRLAKAQEAWPRMIEEIRIQASSLGRSIPQALFDVGRRAPANLQPAFEAAHREWMISTDFERTVGVLKERLADPTADAACETLLIAHELGGADLERRLESLADDRRHDTQNRKDARAKQAGVCFANPPHTRWAA
ncbi:MAG: type II secretion system F family protein [Acidimicrobiales bacterium]